MMAPATERLYDAVKGLLAARGDHDPILRDESLFIMGRLDSLAATELIMLLESDFGIDIGSSDFDMSSLDTIEEIEALIQ